MPGFPVHHQLAELAQTHVPSSRRCHPTISSSVVPFSSCLQSFPASGCFLMSWFFASGGQSIGASASASVLPMNIQDCFPLGLTGLILQSKGLFKSLLQHHSSKASIFQCSAFLMVQLSHLYITTGQSLDSTRWMFVSKAMSLLFNMLSGLSLEKAMAPHSSILAWKFPWTEEPGRPQSMGSLRVGHDSVTSLSLFTFMHWRRKWQPTPVFLPEESQGRGSLVGCHLWGCTESDTTEAT